ncbi:hypothetical protein NXX54_25940 [Bacteroides sp. BFG-638]|uniref:Lipoprotein n=1 Tax=Bacteroides vicugnae TaxID=3037989 RepID=A0ABU5HUU1_9BACE|nr:MULTISPECIES: hypothetical protein [unclassified Bacteroides]MCS2951584.1 hypothetical protein [Bacteroides sp. BFG-638]MCS3315180.1 hypothetical protein [Bacteroides sp. BFG-637]MDY7253010.1 hypothetical protein [Bacteroides sp. A1-P5]MDY7258635.1 hypothetical protein [Bacteroides sp. A2-P53]
MKLLKLLFLSVILLSACNDDSTDTPETGEPKQIIVEMASNDFTDVSGTYTLETNKEYCTREDGKYKILLGKSVYKNKEGKEKDILTYGILDVANKKYICHTANIDVAQRLERNWEFYNQITNPDFPDAPNRRLVCNSYTKKD